MVQAQVKVCALTSCSPAPPPTHPFGRPPPPPPPSSLHGLRVPRAVDQLSLLPAAAHGLLLLPGRGAARGQAQAARGCSRGGWGRLRLGRTRGEAEGWLVAVVWWCVWGVGWGGGWPAARAGQGGAGKAGCWPVPLMHVAATVRARGAARNGPGCGRGAGRSRAGRRSAQAWRGVVGLVCCGVAPVERSRALMVVYVLLGWGACEHAAVLHIRRMRKRTMHACMHASCAANYANASPRFASALPFATPVHACRPQQPTTTTTTNRR